MLLQHQPLMRLCPAAEGGRGAGAHRTHALQQSQWWWRMREGPQVKAAAVESLDCSMHIWCAAACSAWYGHSARGVCSDLMPYGRGAEYAHSPSEDRVSRHCRLCI